MKKNMLIGIVILSMLFSGCAARAVSEQAAIEPIYVEAPALDKGYAPPSAGYEEESAGDAYQNGNTFTERIVIRNADLTIVVSDPIQSQKNITKLAEDVDGYVVNSYSYKVTTESGLSVPAVTITIRVPADKLDEVIEKIKSAVKDQKTDILNEQISGQDVTMEYTDLQSRLRNLDATHDQLMKFLEQAETTEDAMMVYNQLVSINEQIEVLKGQIKYYDESSKLSAISVNIKAEESVQPLTIGKWQPVGVARDAVQALISTGKFLVNALIWIIIVVLPVAIVLYLFVRLVILVIRKVFKIKPRKPKAPAVPQNPLPPQG
jgi:hypothetical protein